MPARIGLRVPLRLELEHGQPTHAPMVHVAIGAIHTRLVLDTGSDVHLLTREIVAAAGELRPIGRGVSGAPIHGASAGPQVLRIAGRQVRLPSVLLRPEMGDPAAMLGQDVLRGTVVAIGPGPDGEVLWQVAALDDAPAG
jgi:hypothetical protein